MCVGEKKFSAVHRQYVDENKKDNVQDNERSDDDVNSNIHDDERHLFQTKGDVKQNFVRTDISDVNKEEKDLVTKFLLNDCCNNKCNTRIPRKTIENTRTNSLELSKNELDLVILSHVQVVYLSQSL